jgi:hypothetical protein
MIATSLVRGKKAVPGLEVSLNGKALILTLFGLHFSTRAGATSSSRTFRTVGLSGSDSNHPSCRFFRIVRIPAGEITSKLMKSALHPLFGQLMRRSAYDNTSLVLLLERL